MLRTQVIAIGGPSCSGKTSLAKRLHGHWGDQRALLISLDRYYLDFSHMESEQRAAVNFDQPDAFESELLLEHLQILANGKPVNLPKYDYATHSRETQTDPAGPREIVVLEGLFPWYWEELQDVLNIRVYIDIDEETALSRRIARDVNERGRSEPSIRSQYETTVAPMQARFVEPMRARADLVVSGRDPIEESFQRILSQL